MTIEHLKCYSELEYLFYRVYPTLRNFPTSEKFSLCADIKSTFLNCLKFMALSGSVHSKKLVYLHEAEGYLQHLTTLIRFSKHEAYISVGFFEDIDFKLTEIKNMVSDVIKNTAKYCST